MAKYFIIVDMQNDFVTGSLKNEAAEKIIPAIVEKAKELKEQGYTIVATRDSHVPEYLKTKEGENLPVEHCIKGTHGWEVVDPIKDLVDLFIDKVTFGFDRWVPELERQRRKNMTREELNKEHFKHDIPEDIRLCGTVTSICVASNYATLKASYPESDIYVYKDLCADITPEGHEAAIKVMTAQHAKIL